MGASAIPLGLLLGLGISGNVAAAVLTVEPAWVSFPHNYSNLALYGQTVDEAGDVNGDGLADLVVGAPGSDLGCCQPGAVFVFHGRPGGPRPQSDWSRRGPGYYDGYGAGVGRAGDVNGDGYDDLVFSASFSVAPNLVLVYHGSATGLAPTAAWSLETTPGGTYWPLPATGAGDVNADGYADLIVGVSGYSGGATNQGRALVFHGSASGLTTTPAWTLTGAAAGENLGFSVASAGDVDGDGHDDVLVANATAARLYRGSSAGLGTVPSWTVPIHPYVYSFSGHRDSLGEVAGAGDVDGDGYDDVLVGSPTWSAVGRVELFRGSAAGLSTTPVWTVQGSSGGRHFGCSVDGAGDVNGDDFADVIVGTDPFYRGSALVYLGGSGGPATTAAWSVEGATDDSQFGRSVRGGGDVNGDGRDDVIVGAREYWGLFGGRALLFLGEPHAPTSAVPETPGLRLFRDTDGTLYFGWQQSCAGTETDWEVYEGALGDFSSHVPVLCTTGWSRWTALTPQSGDSYYLVVPRTLDFEGAYGKTSSGVERPVSVEACRPQSIVACP